MALTLTKQTLDTSSKPISITDGNIFEKIVEAIWFFLSFALFIVLGPFSAPIALIALLQLGFEDNDQEYPESIG